MTDYQQKSSDSTEKVLNDMTNSYGEEELSGQTNIDLDQLHGSADVVGLFNCVFELSYLTPGSLKFLHINLIIDFETFIKQDPDLYTIHDFPELLNTKCTRNCLAHILLFVLRKDGPRVFTKEEFVTSHRVNSEKVDQQIQKEMIQWDEYKSPITDKSDKVEALRARPFLYKLVNCIDSIGRNMRTGLLGFYGSRINTIIHQMPTNITNEYMNSNPNLSSFECSLIFLFYQTNPEYRQWLGALINNIMEAVFLFKYSVEKASAATEMLKK